MILLPFLISLVLGSLLLVSLPSKKKSVPLDLFLYLSLGIGLAASGFLIYFSLLVFSSYKPVIILILHGCTIGSLLIYLVLSLRKGKKLCLFHPSVGQFLGFLILIVASIPLWQHAHFYLHGGWDAWSTWNLKSKFIFLGGENWKQLFDPLLWRSSPHYPLLLPLINTWTWIFSKTPTPYGPLYVSYTITFLTCGVLYASLRHCLKTHLALLPSLLLLSMPMFIKYSLSQYADIMVGYFILCGLVCMYLAMKERSHFYLIVSAISLGCLCFVKNEGLVASFIIAALFLPSAFLNRKEIDMKLSLIQFYFTFVLTLIPTILFKLMLEPDNQTFINGFTSSTDPSTLLRLKTILLFYVFEMAAPLWNMFAWIKNMPEKWVYITLKWSGVWMVIFVMALLTIKNSFHRLKIFFPAFFFSYAMIILLYYLCNTYFQIEWWLQVTLGRLIFAVLPSALFWVFISTFEHSDRSSQS